MIKDFKDLEIGSEIHLDVSFMNDVAVKISNEYVITSIGMQPMNIRRDNQGYLVYGQMYGSEPINILMIFDTKGNKIYDRTRVVVKQIIVDKNAPF